MGDNYRDWCNPSDSSIIRIKMENLKILINENNNILQFGKTGVYLNKEEFSQFLVNWITQTSDSKKEGQLENLGKTLVVSGLFALFLSACLKK